MPLSRSKAFGVASASGWKPSRSVALSSATSGLSAPCKYSRPGDGGFGAGAILVSATKVQALYQRY